MKTRKVRSWLTLIVVAHFVVNLIHGLTHATLEIELPFLATFYVMSVILVVPLLGLGLLFSRYAKEGVWVTLVSMLGSLLFGVAYHYWLPGPDNLTQLTLSDWSLAFQLTALALTFLEGAGVGLSLWLFLLFGKPTPVHKPGQ